MTDLKKLREIADAATPIDGLYLDRADFEHGASAYEIHGHVPDSIVRGDGQHMFVAFRTDDHRPAMRAKFNAEFWLAARGAVPVLLDRLEAAERELDAARRELGVPQPDYPAPFANAARIISAALAEIRRPIE